MAVGLTFESYRCVDHIIVISDEFLLLAATSPDGQYLAVPSFASPFLSFTRETQFPVSKYPMLLNTSNLSSWLLQL